MFCSNCGKELPEGAKFCPSCGSEVGVTIKPKEVFKSVSNGINVEKTSEDIKKITKEIKDNPRNILQKKFLIPIIGVAAMIGLLFALLGGNGVAGRYSQYQNYDGSNSQSYISLCKDGSFFEMSTISTKTIGKYTVDKDKINLYYSDNSAPITYTLKDKDLCLGDYVIYSKGKGVDSKALKKTSGKINGVYKNRQDLLGVDRYYVFDGNNCAYIYKLGDFVIENYSGEYKIKDNILTCGENSITIEKISDEQIIAYEESALDNQVGYIYDKIDSLPEELKEYANFISSKKDDKKDTDNKKNLDFESIATTYLGMKVVDVVDALGNYTAHEYSDAPGASLYFDTYPYSFSYCSKEGAQAGYPFNDSDILYSMSIDSGETIYGIKCGSTTKKQALDAIEANGKTIDQSYYDMLGEIMFKISDKVSVSIYCENDIVSNVGAHVFIEF